MSNPDYLIAIPGAPVPKERPRVGGHGKVYTPVATRDYEAHVAMCAARLPRLRGPLRIIITAVLTRPPSHKSRAEGLIWRPRRPDVDNLAKAILDGFAHRFDDGQVVDLRIRKLDSEPGGEGRVSVAIWKLDAKDDPGVAA